MKNIVLVCALCLYLGESYGTEDTDGVGAFAYNGPSGRYGGTYGLKDGKVVNQQGNLPPNFSPPTFDLDDFFPEYFSNFGNLLQEAFIRPPPFIRLTPFRGSFPKPFFGRTFDSVENQKLAYAAATKAFELTTNRAASNQFFAPSRFPYGSNLPGLDGFQGGYGYQGGSGFQGGQGFQGEPGFQGGSGFQGFPGFQGQGFGGLADMSNYGRSQNSAFAGAAIGPDFRHQVADINPENPNNPNINKYSNIGGQPGGFKSVSSSSYSSSSNINGKKTESRGAETIVNDNGHITKYKVNN